MKKLLQNIFSIKNSKDKKHKKLTILGIKFSFAKKISQPTQILQTPPAPKLPINSLYDIQGLNNKIIIIEPDGSEHEIIGGGGEGLKIQISGCNNVVKLHKPFNNLAGTFIEIDSDSAYVEIGKNATVQNMHLRLKFGKNQRCIIGDNTIFYGGCIVLDEESSFEIGNDCLVAGGFSAWGSDGHSIIDIKTNKVLNNNAKIIKIGDHVWIAGSVTVLKNSVIKNNCVVGARTVVTRQYEQENVVIAGNPGKIIKQGVTWDGCSPNIYYKIHSGK